MTAPDTNSAASDNFVFQETEDGVDTLANDHALVQIIEHAYETVARRPAAISQSKPSGVQPNSTSFSTDLKRRATQS
jgi:hypothetical protein